MDYSKELFELIRTNKKYELKEVNTLIENKADVNFEKGKPICESVFNQRLDVVQLLVEHKADIHVRDDLVAYMANAYPKKEMTEYLSEHDIHILSNMAVLTTNEGKIDWNEYDDIFYEDSLSEELADELDDLAI